MLQVAGATALKAKLFRGFSDRTRLAILEVLGGERSVGDIAQATDSTTANVSAHLACLAGWGLVRGEKGGEVRVLPPAGAARGRSDTNRRGYSGQRVPAGVRVYP